MTSGQVKISGFDICYMLNVCVVSRYLSPAIEILIILSGMSMYLIYKRNVERKKYWYQLGDERAAFCISIFAIENRIEEQ